jgi:hypothetical protein
MRATIYAAFADPANAEKATGALLDHGLTTDEMSLVASRDYPRARQSPELSAERIAEMDAHVQHEIDDNEVTGTSYGHAIVNDMGRQAMTSQTWATPGSSMAYGAEMAGGIESSDAATHYKGGDEPFANDDGAPAYRSGYGADLGVDTPVDDLDRPELSAKGGISTTTPADAGAGAVKGAAVGLGVGIIAAAAAIFVPGIGLVAGGGVLATALAGMVGATGAGVIAGGVVGYLKDQGIPEEAITVYRDAVDSGGAILAVTVPDEYSRADLEAVLSKYGASNIEMYGPVRTL